MTTETKTTTPASSLKNDVVAALKSVAALAPAPADAPAANKEKGKAKAKSAKTTKASKTTKTTAKPKAADKKPAATKTVGAQLPDGAVLKYAKALTKDYGPCVVVRAVTQKFNKLPRKDVLSVAKALRFNMGTAARQFQEARSGKAEKLDLKSL